ncbi:MAG: hypothetical protein RSB04_10730 [Gordonibacter sp.]|uniref:hypothetical protein n=1 Tax=Gordonibacter sp. TaxID=1968902 RepID=UPI002FC5CF40
MKVGNSAERAIQVVLWLSQKDERWKLVNYKKFKALKKMCERAADRGEMITRDDAYHYAKENGWSVADARKMFRRDHDVWSVLTRYMAMQSPKVTRAVVYCTAPIDDAPLIEIWREFVLKAAFVAESWQEAREMCRLEDVSAA